MNMIRALLFLGLLITPMTASAKDMVPKVEVPVADQYVAAMCSAGGDWTGKLEQYNETGLYRTSRLDATFLCQPGKGSVFEASIFIVETNVFFGDDGLVFPTLKVIFPTKNPSEMQMSYFYGGIEKVYFLKASKVAYTNDRQWTVIRESAGRAHETDTNPPLSRYTHIRNGSDLTMIREVKKDKMQAEWTLSSKLILKIKT